MGLARLDPYKITPIVLGGVYCAAQFAEGATDEDTAAVKVTMDIAELVAFWTILEQRQIINNQNPKLNELYARLGHELINMYKVIVILLGETVAYFNSKRREFYSSCLNRLSS